MSDFNSQFDQLLVKVYDKYVPSSDYSYSADSGNLNPKRELDWDRPISDQIIERLQEMTDDIVRRQIEPKVPEERLKGTFGGESIPKGIPLPLLQAIAQSGGTYPIMQVDNLIGDIVNIMPAPFIDELMLPPEIDCDSILGALGFTDEEIDDNREENRNKNPQDSGGFVDETDENEEKNEEESEEETDEDEEDDAPEENDDDFDDDLDYSDDDSNWDEDYAECAQIELGWLKILLMICKVIAAIKRIIEFVIAILMPIVQIICLAMLAWLNPTNIAMIIQFIVSMIIALIMMIISMIIQMIWDLLNLDCVTDQVQKTIDEIKKCLSTFASLTNQFNPRAIALLMDKIDQSLLDPLAQAAEQFKKDAEGWSQIKKEVSSLFTDPEARRKMMQEVGDQIVSGVAGGIAQDPNVSKAAGLVNNVKGTFIGPDSSLGGAVKAIKGLKDWGKTNAVVKKAKAMTQKGSKAAENVAAGSKQFLGMTLS